jgi:hypothetical protein
LGAFQKIESNCAKAELEIAVGSILTFMYPIRVTITVPHKQIKDYYHMALPTILPISPSHMITQAS